MKAFPWTGVGTDGMDLRDYFAAKAMQSLIVDPVINETIEEEGVDHPGFTAYLAYKVADAMMKAREKQ